MKRLVMAASLAAAALLPATAHAQDRWEEQVRQLLQQAGKTVEGQGFELTHNIVTGSLNQGAQETVDMTLDIGKEYRIVGACDTDCSDLDFILYDGNGNQVDSDLQEDDVPIVSVVVSHSGTFRLLVKMVRCSAEPCRYGVGIFGK
jgi:hypothetical protein